jgi:hypothetical protein
VFFGPRYREELIARDESPEVLELASGAEKDARIRVSERELRPNSARGREVLSDGWLWDMFANTPNVQSVGPWSEILVVPEQSAENRRLEIELSSVGGPERQPIRVIIDGRPSSDLDAGPERSWYRIDVPIDGKRHRVRLEYARPVLRTERAPGVRWWWRGPAFQLTAIAFWGVRLAASA